MTLIGGHLVLQPKINRGNNSMSEAIEQFRSITDDHALTEQQIRKYLAWGKGNLEQALNYYFRKKQKSQQINPPQLGPQLVPQTQPQPKLKEKNIFQTMKNASIRQKQTETFIKQVRQEFQLPIGKQQKRSSKSEVEANDEMKDQEYDAEFADADYLPEVFALTKDNKENDEIRFKVPNRSSLAIPEDIQSPEKVQQQIEGNSVDYNEREIKEESKKIEEQKSQKLASKQKSLNESMLSIKSQKSSRQFGWATGQSEICLGQAILMAFAIKFQNNIDLPQGAHLPFRYYIQQEKKKKGFKSKKAEKVMNVRLVHQGSEFGRLKDEQTRIFVPLLVHGAIRMELYAHTIPRRMDYYTNLKIKARIYLLKKAITEPVVETFEGHSDLIVSTYKPIAEEVLALFQRLQVHILTWPLIKRKSKLKSKSHPAISQAKEQQSSTNATQRQKQLSREMRMRNDPFFKSVQKNLSEMMRIGQKEDASNSKKPVKEEQPESAVKKKILQLKTVDEDRCSQLIDLYQEDLQPYKPTANFTSSLYHYQELALAWMMRRQGQSQKQETELLHPLWTEYELPDKRSIFLNQLTSQMSLKPPYSRSKCLGGILADEMGLGKTVMMAALLATNKKAKRAKRQAGNLIVVPLTLLSQWQAQIQRHTKGIKTLVYYSEQRKKYGQSLQKYDVVITTYGTISHQYSRGCNISKTGLYRYKWDRIVLDQAHYIKGRIIQTAKAVYELQGMYRWCLTGTPIQNGLADMFSLIHFIRYTPWAEWECWNKYILKPSEAGEEDVYEVLRTILKRVFLRRTKQSRDPQGKPIVQLPPKSSKVQLLQMNQKQRQFYDSIYESSRLKIEQLQKLGIIQSRYMQVLQILMRLRQICCHPILFKAVHKFTSDLGQFEHELRRFVKKRQQQSEIQNDERYFQPLIQGEQQQRVEVSTSNNFSETFLKETILKIEKRQLQNCLVCLGDVQDPIITSCLHIFCKVCAIRQIQECGICSACRRRITKDDTLPLPRQNRFNASLDNFFPSTKLLALIQHLRKLAPGDKAVVFSQFLGMLDLIEHQLKLEKMTYVRMEGSTSHKERTRIVDTFQKDPTVQIFVVSLKTAGVGLNLVAANKVFLVDPWWNPGVQEQAIERVHRIGQKRSVQVIRFVIDRSIEMRMLQLNTNKKQLSQKVLSHESKASDSRVQKLKYLMAKY